MNYYGDVYYGDVDTRQPIIQDEPIYSDRSASEWIISPVEAAPDSVQDDDSNSSGETKDSGSISGESVLDILKDDPAKSPEGDSDNDTLVESESKDEAALRIQEIARFMKSGAAAFSAGKYAEARGWFIQAVLADDADGVPLFLYGVASFSEADYGVAISALRKSLELTPELIENPIDVRNMYGESAVFDAHLSALRDSAAEQVMNQEPSTQVSDDRKFLLAYLLFASHQPKEAVGVLDGIVATQPDDSLARKIHDAAIRVQAQPEPAAE